MNLVMEFLLAVTASGSLAAIRAANGWGRREPFRVLVTVEDSDHSLGGYIAAQFAIENRKRIEKLVLIESSDLLEKPMYRSGNGFRNTLIVLTDLK